MISVILFLALIGIFLCSCKSNGNDGWQEIKAILWIIVIILGVFLGFGYLQIASYNDDNQKIELYEEENDEIKNHLNKILDNYITVNSEAKKIYGDLPNPDAMDVISIFTDLQKDPIVSEELTKYYENLQAIESIKKEQMRLNYTEEDVSKMKWLLYFGH